MIDRVLIGCDTKWKGDATEALILWKLLSAGIVVLVPWGDNARYDLVAAINDRFVRIQCKTGRLRSRYVAFGTYGVGRDGKRYRYLPGEIDYYGVRCLETAGVYLVPYIEAGSSASPQLRVELPSPGSTGGRQTARVRWAAKYDADVVIESWLRTGGNFEPRWSPPIVESTGECHPSRHSVRAPS
jgi:hypothetical protein